MSFGNMTDTVPYGSCTGGGCGTSSRKKCYERVDIDYTVKSAQTTSMPNGCHTTGTPTNPEPPEAYVTKTLEFTGTVKRDRYCAEPGRTPDKRGEMTLVSSRVRQQGPPGPEGPNQLRLRVDQEHRVVLSYWDCPCNFDCLPTSTEDLVFFDDGCTKKFPTEKISESETKYENNAQGGTRVTQAMKDAIWKLYVNKANPPTVEPCFAGIASAPDAPGRNDYQEQAAEDVLSILCQGKIALGTCCDICFQDDHAPGTVNEFRQKLQDGMKANYNSTHNQSDCKNIQE